jgi:hypothetical protein
MSSVNVDIPDLMRRSIQKAAAITVPKPGLLAMAFSVPWGTLDDALALIRGGRLQEGRDLLASLSRLPKSQIISAHLARDLFRKPEEPRRATEALGRMGVCKEADCVASGRLFLVGEPTDAAGLLARARASRAAAPESGWLQLWAELMAGSAMLHAALNSFPRSQPKEIEGLAVTSLLKGAAHLELREFESAWQKFEHVKSHSAEHAEGLLKAHGVQIGTHEISTLAAMFRSYGIIGHAVTLWDMGAPHLGVLVLTEGGQFVLPSEAKAALSDLLAAESGMSRSSIFRA